MLFCASQIERSQSLKIHILTIISRNQKQMADSGLENLTQHKYTHLEV